MKEKEQKKRLFLICPNQQIETFIREKAGPDAFFLTSLATVFNFSQVEYVEEMLDFICKEKINEIYIVSDVSCRFIQNALEHGRKFGIRAEKVIEEVYLDNYFQIMESDLPEKRKKKLAKLNIERQAEEMFGNALIYNRLRQDGILLKGLLTSKKDDYAVEVGVGLKEAVR